MNNTKKKTINKKLKIKQTVHTNAVVNAASSDSGHLEQQLDQQRNIQYCHKKVYLFMKTLKADYKRLALLYNTCIHEEQERERRNNEEILHLSKVCNQMQSELVNIKRTNWCRYCESEATYLSSDGGKFYCSQECEQKQQEFASVIDNIHI